MAQFPSSIISFSTKVNGQVIDASDVNSPQAEITALENKVGTDGSADTATLDYLVKNPASNGGGHVQTANKGGTGQTSYSKGDLLVATSQSVIGKLAVGGDGTTLLADSAMTNGVKWGSPQTIIVSSILVSSIWTKPTGINSTSRVFVELWGGGGSGGAANAGGNVNNGGGGGGAYVNGYFFASVLGATELIVIGAGGAGVTGSGGNPGGVTVFGTTSSLLSAYGGGGGKAGSGSQAASGGGGGGCFSAGQDGTSDSVDASAGSWGTPFATSVFSSSGSANSSSKNAINSSGGAGSGGSGGSVIYGGGGGGGSASSTWGFGGQSKFGGNGGNASSVNGTNNGSVPGGGGGAGYYNKSSGAGGDGKAIITVFL